MKKSLVSLLVICATFSFAWGQDSIPANMPEKTAGESYAAEKMNQLRHEAADTEKEQKVKVMDGHIEYSAHDAVATVSESEGETVTIYNLSGKAVLEKKVDSDSVEISLSGLGKGVYLLRLGAKTAKIVL